MSTIKLPAIGFGAYRVSIKSPDHMRSLLLAIESGCGLIDTSSNYTDGDSELLIGEVLKKTSKKPIIVTKGGYIQGKNLIELDKMKLAEGVTTVNEGLKHSIHPTFLENQLTNSLIRLGVEQVDIYLLHNPEYYFYEEGATQDEYYNRIEKALLYLEEQRGKGFLKEYGISSNNFYLPLDDPKATQFEKVMEIVKKNNLKGFTTIQFPLNLIELGALEKLTSLSLLDMCLKEGINTMINRPLNAFIEGSLLRLASYEEFVDFPSEEKAQGQFDYCMQLIEQKWQSQENEDENVSDIPVLKQFKELWNNLPTPDAVDQVYFAHLFPLIAGIWGGEGLSPLESKPFYKLYDFSQSLARKQMSDKADVFKKQAIESGLLPNEDKPLSILALEKYQELGIQCSLVGMKEEAYVMQLKHLFD